MPINYALFPNPLTADPSDFTAVVQANGTADFKDIARLIALADNTVGVVDAVAVLEAMERICQELLIDGKRVVLGGLVQLFPRVRGVFDSAAASFDPLQHRIDVGANPGQRVRNSVRSRAAVQKVQAVRPAPEPLHFVDVSAQQANGPLTPNGIGKLQGSRLRFEASAPDEGLYFIPTGGGPPIRVELYSEIRPAQVQFQIPLLPPGDYTLEVRARSTPGGTLRTGALQPTLTV